SSTEKLTARGLSGRAQAKLTRQLLDTLPAEWPPENIPSRYLARYKLMPRPRAYRCIHFPPDESVLKEAIRRIKFEELFTAQVRMCRLKLDRHRHSRGWPFEQVGEQFNRFYHDHLPFRLTEAQKRVLREIRRDT